MRENPTAGNVLLGAAALTAFGFAAYYVYKAVQGGPATTTTTQTSQTVAPATPATPAPPGSAPAAPAAPAPTGVTGLPTWGYLANR